MVAINEKFGIGDIVLWEAPDGYCRENAPVVPLPAAVADLGVGCPMDFSAAVAATQTMTMVTASASGSVRIGYKGLWTTAIAWNDNAAAINGHLDAMTALLPGGAAGDIVFSVAASFATTGLFTFLNTAGNTPLLKFDTRLLLTAGGLEAVATVVKTVGGALATHKLRATTAVNVDSILLEEVPLADYQQGEQVQLMRSFLVRGPSVVNVDRIFPQIAAGTIANVIIALEALGIQCYREPTMTNVGLPIA